MINPLAPSASTPLSPSKPAGVAQAAPTRPTDIVRDGAVAVARPAAAMAAAGAPVDTAKVARIKAAIAGGTYQPDSAAIADAMVELDMPERA